MTFKKAHLIITMALFGANNSFDREFARQAAEAVIDESENAVFAQLDKIQSEDPQTQAQ